MRRLVLAATAAAAFGVVPAAYAGGIALDVKRPPGQLAAGDSWRADIGLRACAGARLTGRFSVRVVITNVATGKSVFYPARRARSRYTARVVFPSAGTWAYSVRVNDWTDGRHGTVRVEGRAPSGGAFWPLGGGLVLAFALASSRLLPRGRGAATGRPPA